MSVNRKIEFFPDGSEIAEWFYDLSVPGLNELGKPYVLTEHGILDDGRVHTREIQELIDRAAEEERAVIVVPRGCYITGALFFRQNVNLYLMEGAMLRGSDDPSDYPVQKTRIEGESCLYLPALINADSVDGFVISGSGCIDGNGLRSWKSFWQRRQWNPECTNKDEQRARLLFISKSKNVLISGVSLQNSQFWTSHIYKCERVKYIGCRFFAPAGPVKAPSTDAIDIDVCRDVLVKNCYMEVNDDAVVLKGGKGPWADSCPENGSNERIIVEDCEYGFCHGCLVCGSESVHNRNIILRRIKVGCGNNLLWLKMRPDTPQHYEYIEVRDIDGSIVNFININPWTQFYDLKDRKDIPLSYASNIVMADCNCECEHFFNVDKKDSEYLLSDFYFEGLNIRARINGFDESFVQNMKSKDVKVEPLA